MYRAFIFLLTFPVSDIGEGGQITTFWTVFLRQGVISYFFLAFKNDHKL